MSSTQLDTLHKYTTNAKAIAWDTCHKIYVLMDNEQVDLMREYGYDELYTSNELNSVEMADQVMDWYNESCGLRFVTAVHTNHENPNAGYIDIISQGDDEEES